VQEKGAMTKRDLEKIDKVERVAMNMTESIGSPKSLVVHTILFIVIFGLYFFGVSFESILLILTTAVSLEAIYLAIFIQMTVNRNTQSLEEVEEDIDEIQKDVDEVQKDIDEIQKDVDEIEEDMDVIHKDDEADVKTEQEQQDALKRLEKVLYKVLEDIDNLKKK
jgi:low affinity Fe/Cu permease